MTFTILECFTGEKGYLRDNHTERLEDIVVEGVKYFVDPFNLPRVAYRFIRECTLRYEEAVVVPVTNPSTLRKIARQILQEGGFMMPDGTFYVSETDIEREYSLQNKKGGK